MGIKIEGKKEIKSIWQAQEVDPIALTAQYSAILLQTSPLLYYYHYNCYYLQYLSINACVWRFSLSMGFLTGNPAIADDDDADVNDDDDEPPSPVILEEPVTCKQPEEREKTTSVKQYPKYP